METTFWGIPLLESEDKKYDASVKGAFDMLTKFKAFVPEDLEKPVVWDMALLTNEAAEHPDALLAMLDQIHKDQISGGKGDQAKPSDFSVDEVLKGIAHEMEHTKDSMKALDIALDHLSENPEYYTALANAQIENVDAWGIPL